MIILLILIGYVACIILWSGKKRLQEKGLFKGALLIAYSGVLGIVGASMLKLHIMLFGNHLEYGWAVAISLIIMCGLCFILYKYLDKISALHI